MPTRPPTTRNVEFEQKTTATLAAQDRILEQQNNTLETQNRFLQHLDKKLSAPVLNGGFDELVKQVEKVKEVTEQLKDCHDSSSKKIVDIHTAIYDPEKGIYVTVKEHETWINTAAKALKWAGALVLTGTLTGLAKVIYDMITGHIHYTP